MIKQLTSATLLAAVCSGISAQDSLDADDYACAIVAGNQGESVENLSQFPAPPDGPDAVLDIFDLMCAVGFCNVKLTNETPNKLVVDSTEGGGSVAFFSGDVCDPDVEAGCNDGAQTYLAIARIGQPFAPALPVPVPELPVGCDS